jgi:hypothetical protein
MPLSGSALTAFLDTLPPEADRFACQEAGETAPAVPGKWVFFEVEDVTFYVPRRYRKERRWNRILDRSLHWSFKREGEE